ncbi:MAG: GAF domain-containing protein, partial [Anaerolineae bacterium]|nr:GAF domain-containing protein [Anaerolineae bacterium]
DSPSDVVRYQEPTVGTQFVLVNEASAASITTSFGRILISRGFVLVLGVGGLVLVLVLGGNQMITPPLARIRNAIRAMASGNFAEPVPDMYRNDEIGQLAGSFADMRQQVQTLIQDLENRVEARTRDISATQDISNYAATQRDQQSLMDQVVNLIVDRFDNIYHAQIFLVDSDRRYAVLRASTGAAGKRLLEVGHRLGVGSVSVIGMVTDMGEYVIARDTGDSRIHRRNEFLPDTRAELAIPMRNASGEVIGALDVQSVMNASFDDDQVKVLQTMADQISVAIENARLYEDSLRRLQEIERSRRAATLGAWREQMRQARTQRKQSAAGNVPAQNEEISALRQQAMEQGETVVGQPTTRRTIPVAIPIRLRDQVLGAVEWELPQATFDQNKLQLAEALVNRLAIGLENARLFQESQRAADREHLVNEIATRLAAQSDVNQILQTAVREVGQALRAPQVSIRLGASDPAPNGNNDHNQNGNGHNGHSNGQSQNGQRLSN